MNYAHSLNQPEGVMRQILFGLSGRIKAIPYLCIVWDDWFLQWSVLVLNSS